MSTPGERKALVFLGGVILLGAGMRSLRAHASDVPADSAARTAIDAQIAAVESTMRAAKGKGKGKRKSARKPPVVPAIVDLDIATAAEIETLRWVGPALAARIIADRDSAGPFGSLKELERVRGIGPALATKLEPAVTFSLLPRPSFRTRTQTSGPRPRDRKLRPRRATQLPGPASYSTRSRSFSVRSTGGSRELNR